MSFSSSDLEILKSLWDLWVSGAPKTVNRFHSRTLRSWASGADQSLEILKLWHLQSWASPGAQKQFGNFFWNFEILSFSRSSDSLDFIQKTLTSSRASPEAQKQFGNSKTTCRVICGAKIRLCNILKPFWEIKLSFWGFSEFAKK